MAIKNSYELYIGGINYTHYAVLPLKIGKFFDEQLDEGSVSLRKMPVKHFAPLTPLEIIINNELSFQGKSVRTESNTYYFLVSTDKATESPIGSGRYDHEITFIECTKIAERIIVDSCTFTNRLGVNYLAGAKAVVPEQTYTTEHAYSGGDPKKYPAVTPARYMSPLAVAKEFCFASAYTIFPYYDVAIAGKYGIINKYWFEIRKNGILIFTSGEFQKYRLNSGWEREGVDEAQFLTLEEGTYSVKYYYNHLDETHDNSYFSFTNTATYTFSVVSNKYPLKKWTIASVINRLCDIAEPLRKGDTPRFYLDEEQAEIFDKVLAPEFSFTKQTFRECLQEAGKVIHAEPRLIPVNTNGVWRWKLTYDRYGGMEKSRIAEKNYVAITQTHDITDYCANVDSSAENMLNTLGSNEYGTITEPNSRGYKTVRTATDEGYARLTEENIIPVTQFPIYQIQEVVCVLTEDNSNVSEQTKIDITSYVFEHSVYTSQLSSYEGTFPYAKCYAIYYTQGEKNLGGLTFKNESATYTAFNNYAIVNILRVASGNSSLKISDYRLLAFRITYTPFYNSRIGQSKVNCIGMPKSALVYNQSANIIDSRAYGENLKGAVARLGNIEKTLVYYLGRLSDIPKTGQLLDDDYYIASISTELNPTYIKCEIGLSKDFNRLSQYIGINSEKRFSEVSETQAQERNVLYRQYIVVGKEPTDLKDDVLVGYGFMEGIREVFFIGETGAMYAPGYSTVIAWGVDTDDNVLTPVTLPVITSAFGNSIAYSWQYEDNYSAGARVFHIEDTENNIDNYYCGDVPYSNFYGTLYYYHFTLLWRLSSTAQTLEQAKVLPQYVTDKENDAYIGSIPGRGGTVATQISGMSKITPFILRKDSREILQVNLQIDFVSNDEKLIIGSALALSTIRGQEKTDDGVTYTTKLYVFDKEIEKFTNDLYEQGIDISKFEGVEVEAVTHYATGCPVYQVVVTLPDGFPASGKSWAICTGAWTETIDVTDELGNDTKQTTRHGGELLIGKNEEVKAGDTFKPIYFTPVADVLDNTVWKDKK